MSPTTAGVAGLFMSTVLVVAAGSVHRVRLTVSEDGSLRFVEHFVDEVLRGCGPATVMLPRAVQEQVASRLLTRPETDPMLWGKVS